MGRGKGVGPGVSKIRMRGQKYSFGKDKRYQVQETVSDAEVKTGGSWRQIASQSRQLMRGSWKELVCENEVDSYGGKL